MILDSSALVAIVLREPASQDLLARIGCVTAKGAIPAALNFGDCMSYAMATVCKVPGCGHNLPTA